MDTKYLLQGGLLDYKDIQIALDSGLIGGLGLDVYHTEPFPMEDPLLRHPKVIATPHVAGVTESSYKEMACIVADNVRRLRSGRSLLGVVNH